MKLSHLLVAPLFDRMNTRNGALFNGLYSVSATLLVLLYLDTSQIHPFPYEYKANASWTTQRQL